MATSDSPLSVPNITLAVARGAAQPAPAGAPVISSVTDNGDGTLTITGSGFGTKAQPPPKLVDYVSVAYENGVENTVGASWPLGTTMPTITGGETSAVWRSSTATMQIINNKSLRHAGLSRLYSGVSADAWLGTPTAYSAQEGTLPSGKQPLYLSWWLRQKYPTQSYWGALPTVQPSIDFIVDEPIVCNGYTGLYAGKASTPDGDIHYLFFDEAGLVARYKGFTVTGQTSGAEMVFPDVSRGASGAGFTTAGSKYMRIWDDPSGSTTGQFRASIASGDHYLRVLGGDRVIENQGGQAIMFPQPNTWAHVEVEFDPQVGMFKVYLDNELKSVQNSYDPTLGGIESLSPTPTLVGVNGVLGETQETDISELYVDQGLSRVYLANAATWDAVTHAEVQPPTSWADGSVSVDKYDGALTGSVWVYVVNSGGSINSAGVGI